MQDTNERHVFRAAFAEIGRIVKRQKCGGRRAFVDERRVRERLHVLAYAEPPVYLMHLDDKGNFVVDAKVLCHETPESIAKLGKQGARILRRRLRRLKYRARHVKWPVLGGA